MAPANDSKYGAVRLAALDRYEQHARKFPTPQNRSTVMKQRGTVIVLCRSAGTDLRDGFLVAPTAYQSAPRFLNRS